MSARSLPRVSLPVRATSTILLTGALLAETPLHAQQSLGTQDPTLPPPTSTPWTQPDGKGLVFQAGEYTLKLGGYVKVDLIHDFDPIGSKSNFDPRTIPTDGSDGVNTLLQANQTRLNLDVRGPSSSEDPLRVFVEGDFEGSGNAFRLRQAYGVVGPVLGGQTWTNFMDEDGMPETLDFESPIGFPQIRQAQVRYTNELANKNSFAFSIEDPAPNIIGVDTTTGSVEATIPDVTANYIWRGSSGHLQVSGFGGSSSYNPDVGSTESVALWGVNISTKLLTWGDDNVILQFTYGDGVGRYRGGVTAAPDAAGDLEAVTTTAVMASYQHFWSEKYRSNLCYSWADGDLPDGSPADSPETVTYFAVNFIWQFSERAWTGIEYLYGTNAELDGSDGDANRLQMSIKFSL